MMCSMHSMAVSAVLFMAFIPAPGMNVDTVSNLYRASTDAPHGQVHFFVSFRNQCKPFPPGGLFELVRVSAVYFQHIVEEVVPTAVMLLLNDCSSGFDMTGQGQTYFLRDGCPAIPEVTVLENGVSLHARFSVLASVELLQRIPAGPLNIACTYWICDPTVSICSPVCPKTKQTDDGSVKEEL